MVQASNSQSNQFLQRLSAVKQAFNIMCKLGPQEFVFRSSSIVPFTNTSLFLSLYFPIWDESRAVSTVSGHSAKDLSYTNYRSMNFLYHQRRLQTNINQEKSIGWNLPKHSYTYQEVRTWHSVTMDIRSSLDRDLSTRNHDLASGLCIVCICDLAQASGIFPSHGLPVGQPGVPRQQRSSLREWSESYHTTHRWNHLFTAQAIPELLRRHLSLIS